VAIAIVDEVLMREPRLLRPKMQPTRQTRVDWDNPIAKGLKAFVIPGFADAVSGTPMSVAPTAMVGKECGLGTRGPARAYWATSNFTLSLPYSAFTCYTASNNGQAVVMIMELYVASTMRLQLTTDWDTASLEVVFNDAGSSYSKTVGNGFRANGKPLTVFGTTVDATSFAQTYCDGIAYGSGTDARTLMDAKPGIYLGASSTNTIHDTYAVFAGMVWQRVLSPGEVASISSDPYQLLLPA
jgi:hypothetical protein